MAAAAPSGLVSTPTRPLVYLDIDIDGHAAAHQRAQDFIAATNQRYGWSSRFLSDLGGSERSRIKEQYDNDFDWSGRGRIELDPFPHTRVVFALYADVAPNCAMNFACLCTGEKGKAKGSGKAQHTCSMHTHASDICALLQTSRLNGLLFVSFLF